MNLTVIRNKTIDSETAVVLTCNDANGIVVSFQTYTKEGSVIGERYFNSEVKPLELFNNWVLINSK